MITDVLDRHRIQVIIDLNGFDPSDEHQQAELRIARRREIRVKRFRLKGSGTGDIHCYAAAISEIDRCVKSRMPVLIHCHAGSSRTGAAVAFYRILVQQWSPADAMREMSRFKSHLNSKHVLIVYMNENMTTLAQLLVQAGVLTRLPDSIPQFE